MNRRNTIGVSILALSAAMLQLVNATELNIQPKIYNGITSNTQEHPYMVALLQSNKTEAFQAQFCGGTLIAKNWVLTAAHCVFNKTTGKAIAPDTIDILVNRSDLKAADGERMGVESIILHQFYNAKTVDNDIALVKLKSSASATPIELLSEFSEQDGAGISTKTLGWGNAFESSLWGGWNRVNWLQQATLPIISNEACLKTTSNTGAGTITNNKLCAGFINGSKSACRGDSGGPLVVYDAINKISRQVGIFSASKACNSYGTYGIYTRVKNYKSTISDIICSADEKPAAPTLTTSLVGKQVYLTWRSPNVDTQYQLIYKARNETTPHSIEMNNRTDYTDLLRRGDDYDVAIKASKGNCVSDYSNIERVFVP